MRFGRRFNVHERHCGTVARSTTTTASSTVFIFAAAAAPVAAATPGQKFDTLDATIPESNKEGKKERKKFIFYVNFMASTS